MEYALYTTTSISRNNNCTVIIIPPINQQLPNSNSALINEINELNVFNSIN